MKRLTAVAIVLVCLLCFSACTGNTIGKISGAENEYIYTLWDCEGAFYKKEQP